MKLLGAVNFQHFITDLFFILAALYTGQESANTGYFVRFLVYSRLLEF